MKKLALGLLFFAQRFPIRLVTLFRIIDLTLRNLFLRPSSAILEGGQLESSLVVSLTSYGKRIRWCHLAIESIIQSGCIASNIHLWIPKGSEISQSLQRLSLRGLNIMYVNDQRSHTKYCYLGSVSLSNSNLGYLLSDDDMIYPRTWYPRLLSAASKEPDIPAVNFGTQISIRNGNVTFFSELDSGDDLVHFPKELLFHPFSGSGLYIPGRLLQKVNRDPAAFMLACPTQDDIWLHREFFRMGLPIRDLGGKNMPPSIPFVAEEGLFLTNWAGGQNEVQLKTAFRDLI
jgi:hypothetical protein